MAYYAALISLVQLVKEISHPDDYRYPYYPHDRQQITSLCEKLSHLQELLEDYSPKDHEEEADSLERRIRDLAYQAQDFIESHFSDQIPSNRNFMIQGGKSYSVQRFRQQVDKVKVQRLLQQVEKVKVEVDSIREELLRIKESYKARENDLQLKNSNISADGELLPLLQLLEEISHHDRYPKSFLDKAQLASLYEKVKLLQELQDKEKFADFIGRRIADATYRARDIIETHLSNKMLGDLTLSILAKEYHDLEKVKEEVGSIVEEMMRIKMESLTTHHNQDEQETTIKAQPCGESSKLEAVSIVGTGDTEISGGTPKVQAPSGRNIMVGFDEHLTKIKEQLCGQSSRLEVISIVGMGGIGKTTLARNIFDDKLVDDYFDCCSFLGYCHSRLSFAKRSFSHLH